MSSSYTTDIVWYSSFTCIIKVVVATLAQFLYLYYQGCCCYPGTIPLPVLSRLLLLPWHSSFTCIIKVIVATLAQFLYLYYQGCYCYPGTVPLPVLSRLLLLPWHSPLTCIIKVVVATLYTRLLLLPWYSSFTCVIQGCCCYPGTVPLPVLYKVVVATLAQFLYLYYQGCFCYPGTVPLPVLSRLLLLPWYSSFTCIIQGCCCYPGTGPLPVLTKVVVATLVQFLYLCYTRLLLLPWHSSFTCIIKVVVATLAQFHAVTIAWKQSIEDDSILDVHPYLARPYPIPTEERILLINRYALLCRSWSSARLDPKLEKKLNLLKTYSQRVDDETQIVADFSNPTGTVGLGLVHPEDLFY
ncbi:uncharacterized protein LOC111705012 [Eurytemora carolleeae]|uniref:uncharacterized protein LOC111705012 n=1 Tax=Eurytemora carolleeae TaxID=1294199 RepID=UPI000C78490F|nr:uncharacterized protein LOC111705012 [Eurytemora carolleeae]|eukprot:XP_023333206.1 uncharacterized protein LOC111705012 [Eurytemora affinis]